MIGKLRGVILPGRLRISARRGVTLIELLIAMLILAIVCVAWLEIIGIQSARREARRREAVERLAGMMDAFMYLNKNNTPSPGNYYLKWDPVHKLSVAFESVSDSEVSKRFPESLPDPEDKNTPPRNLLNLDPIGYRLVVVANLTTVINNKDLDQDLLGGNASSYKSYTTAGWDKKRWLIGLLYDKQGKKDEAGRPFFRLPVCLGK